MFQENFTMVGFKNNLFSLQKGGKVSKKETTEFQLNSYRLGDKDLKTKDR